MSTIRTRAEEYLAMRRGLGFQLTSFEQKLLSFVGYLEAHDLDVITVDAALAWATATPRSTDEVHWSRRLMVVRVFARHLAVLDPRTQIPPSDLLPHHYRRVTPYLFGDDEITRLMEAAGALRPTLRGLTWQTLLGLLTVTGLRVAEACGLDRADVDLDDLLSDRAEHQVRQTPAGPDPSQHRGCVARVRPCPRPGSSPIPPRPGSSTPAAIAWTRRTSPTPSAPCSALRPSPRRPGAAGRGCTTSATGSAPPRCRVVSRRRRRRRADAPAHHLSGTRGPEVDLLVPDRHTGAARVGRRPARERPGRGAVMNDLAPLLQAFFSDRLIRQRQASPHTIAAYRDTIILLLGFLRQQTGRQPATLSITDLDAPTVGAFLTHLETDRGNTTVTRNARLAAIHSLFRYAALRDPDHAALIQRVLAIPPKRTDRAILDYLTRARMRRADRHTRPDHQARPPRPRAAPPGHPHRAAGSPNSPD